MVKKQSFNISMKDFIKTLRRYVAALIFEWRLKRAIAKADSNARLYRCKHLVLVWGGKPVVLQARAIPALIRKGVFHRGTKTRKVVAHAVYEANWKPQKQNS